MEDRGMKHDVKVFSALRISLFNGMHCVGENHNQIVCAEGVRLSPQSDLYLPFGTIDELKIIMPVQGKRGNPLGDAPHVDAVGEGDDAVKLCLVYWCWFHGIPP